MAWGLDVKHPRSLASCIRRIPTLSVKICVKKCVLYTRNYGTFDNNLGIKNAYQRFEGELCVVL